MHNDLSSHAKDRMEQMSAFERKRAGLQGHEVDVLHRATRKLDASLGPGLGRHGVIPQGNRVEEGGRREVVSAAPAVFYVEAIGPSALEGQRIGSEVEVSQHHIDAFGLGPVHIATARSRLG
jgi:hypothetical protein